MLVQFIKIYKKKNRFSLLIRNNDTVKVDTSFIFYFSLAARFMGNIKVKKMKVRKAIFVQMIGLMQHSLAWVN